MNSLVETDPELAELIHKEQLRQQQGLELIASENYASRAVMEAMGTVLTNKYSEGYPGKRYYAGNEVIDEIESLAVDRARALFSAEHVNVQPLSGTPANAAVYFALAKPGDKIMGLKLDHGGHLSHGHPVNFSGKLFEVVQYGVDEDTGLIDMEAVRRIAQRERPRILVVGFSAYSRDVDWRGFRAIADEVGAIAFADIAHIAGLIAGGVLENPVPYFDVVTTTTHKTLRGPRGGVIFCREKYKKAIDRSVFPGLQGGPHDHINAAKAVCFKEALSPSFGEYARRVVANARALARALQGRGFDILTGGTDNHLMVVDLRGKSLTGVEAERALDAVGISCSRSTIPKDPRGAMDPSGIRLGTPALTTRGMGEEEMTQLAAILDEALEAADSPPKLQDLKERVREMCARHPLYAPSGVAG